MSYFILFGKNLFSVTGYDTLKLIFSEVLHDPDVMYISPRVTNGERWVNFWERKRGFRKWTSWFGVPFRKAAYKSILCNHRFDKNDELIFIFFCNENWYLGKDGFLAYLRREYPNSKCVYKLLNLVEYINEDLEVLTENYDLVLAGDPQDSAHYQLPYHDLGYSEVCFPVNSKPYCDCFYIGASKNRLDEIHNVYKKLTSNGLKCLFYIVGVSENEQLSEEGLIYNSYLNYDEIVQHVQHSKVVLEIVQERQQAPTLRLFECVAYNKVLLTNNAALLQSPYYCEKIQVFDKTEDINISSLKQTIEDNTYPNKNLLGPREMLRFIGKECKKND